MKITIQPKTRAGKWSVVLFIVFILLAMAAGIISSVQENTIEYPTPLNSPLLGTTIYLMFTAAIIASIASLIAVRKNNERSIFVYISIPLGIAFLIGILMLLIGNIIGPPSQ
ncbi:MAG: hypothetical protein ABFD18_18630 [Syntrophomonas sp.]